MAAEFLKYSWHLFWNELTNGYEGDSQEHMLDRKSVLTTLSYFKQLYCVVVTHFDEKNKLCS